MIRSRGGASSSNLGASEYTSDVEEAKSVSSNSQYKANATKSKFYLVRILIISIFFFGIYHLYKTSIALSETRLEIQDKSDELKDCMLETKEQDIMISKLEFDLLQARQKSLPPQDHASNFAHVYASPSGGRSHGVLKPYDLRDVLFLPRDTPDNDVMQTFVQQWGVNSNLYGHCGLVTSRGGYEKPIYPKKTCNIAIISSWYPRPCGIATHSAKLVEGLKHVCPSGSSIDVIAVSAL